MQARFGFLYHGYSFPYWETFEMVRKLLIGAIPVFVPAQPFGSTQARLTCPVEAGFTCLTMICEPRQRILGLRVWGTHFLADSWHQLLPAVWQAGHQGNKAPGKQSTTAAPR